MIVVMNYNGMTIAPYNLIFGWQLELTIKTSDDDAWFKEETLSLGLKYEIEHFWGGGV